MATEARTAPSTALARRAGAARLPRCSPAAWAAVALVAAFIVISCWWLSQDTSIPVFDAGMHLGYAFDAYEALRAGHLARALTQAAPYPPLVYLVGALGVFAGGIGVAPPIVAQNLVFVPLLALGCYQVGRLAFGRLAGVLAVLFALGSPMIIEEFHEFMLDAPEAALVALAVWAILASERFLRLGVCALAGAAVGLGMLTKETFVFFVAGVALAAAVRGGWRAWRGIALFAAVALAIALPWYLYELHAISGLGNEAFGSSGALSRLRLPAGIAPPRLSAANLEWYLWSFLNWQLLVPLFAFAAVGGLWTLAGFARRRPVSRFAVELACGAFGSWLAITETFAHDARYSLPMLVYLAVFGACWIPRLPRPATALAASALVLVAVANTLGVSFGVGSTLTTAPTNVAYEQQPDRLTFYANYGFWIGPPARDGDLLALLRRLRRAGVREVHWYSEREVEIEFSPPGIAVLARIAGLRVPSGPFDPRAASRADAVLLHGGGEPGFPPPCVTLRDGAGVWVRRGGSEGAQAWGYCPRGA